MDWSERQTNLEQIRNELKARKRIKANFYNVLK